MAKRQVKKKTHKAKSAKKTKPGVTAKRHPASNVKKKAKKQPARPKAKAKPTSKTKSAKKGKGTKLRAPTSGKGSASALKAATASTDESKTLVPVPLPEGVRLQRVVEGNERSAHLEKLQTLFDTAPISRSLGMSLGYCENGVARVRLPYRPDFEEGHGVIHGGLIGLLSDTAGNYAVGSVSPGSTVKTVEFKLSLLAGVQGDLLAIGEVVRKGRTLATCRLEVVEGNDRVVAIGLATYALQAV